MQKIILQIILLFISLTIMNAQNVGIGTATPHSSAKLDIEDNNKGILVPRIDIPNLNAAAPVTTPATSLLVYNTNVTTGVGYYYWEGTKWSRIEDESTSKWVDGSDVGRTPGVIYAREALTNGNTVSVDTDGFISSNGLNVVNQTINSLGAGPRELFRISHVSLCTGGIFSISATRGNFVHTSTWSWNSNHNATGRGTLTKLSGGQYSSITVYLDVISTGNAIISADWGAAQTINISVIKLSGGALDLTQAGADWTTPSTGYGRVESIATKTLSFQTRNGLFSGNVGIGTSTPAARLEVCGNTRIVGQIQANSSSLSAGLTCSSDERLKREIKEYKNALATIEALSGKTYYWKTEEFADRGFDERLKYGFIAQEVEQVLPNLVYEDKKGYKSVDYIQVIPILTNAVQEQQLELKAVKEENQDLKNVLKQMEKRLNALEAQK